MRCHTAASWMGMLALCLIAVLALSSSSEREHLGWMTFTHTGDIRALYRKGDTLWVGTNGGLVLFDLRIDEPVGKITAGRYLPSSSIRSITGRGSQVFVGTDEGLSIFMDDSVAVYSSSRFKGFEDIRHVTWTSDSALYIGTFGHGVTVMRENRMRFIDKADSLLDNKVYSILQSNDSTIYYATSTGLCAFRDSVWSSYQSGYRIPRGEVKALAQARSEWIYVLVGGRGLYSFNGRRARRILSSELFKENDVAAIAVERDGALWAVGRFGGIARYTYGEWMTVGESDPEIHAARWRSAYVDSSGIAYFGSANGMLVKWEEGRMTKHRIASDLPSNYIHACVEDSIGRLYFACGDQLLTYDPDENRFYMDKPPNPVVSLAVSPSGGLWFSTRWAVYRTLNGSWEVLPSSQTEAPSHILSLAFDRHGRLWAGLYTGDVYRYDGDIWMLYGDSDELLGGPVDKIVIDGQDRVCALSRFAGISVFDGLRWTNLPLSAFDSREARDMAMDPFGRLVIVLDDRLLRSNHRGDWEVVLSDAGHLNSVVFDKLGRIYLGMEHSLLLLDGAEGAEMRRVSAMGGKVIHTMIIDRRGVLWLGFREDGISMVDIEELW